MKVFLVFEDDSTWTTCANGDFYGVFSTRALAEEFIRRHPDGVRKFPGYFGMVIDERELDDALLTVDKPQLNRV